MRSVRKGDVVKHYASIDRHLDRASNPDMYGRTGIVISVKKKEVARNKSKHVMEIVIAHTAVVMWNTGELENDVPLDTLELVSRGK